MLNERGIDFEYREYTKDPLDEAEIRDVLAKLGMQAKDVLRKRDKATKELGLTGDEGDDVIIPHMAKNPGMLQRPIGVVGDKAVVGRPVENLLELV